MLDFNFVKTFEWQTEMYGLDLENTVSIKNKKDYSRTLKTKMCTFSFERPYICNTEVNFLV